MKLKNTNFNYNSQSTAIEYSNLGVLVDFNPEHEKNLHPGIPQKDRYSDIKSYKNNIISIKTDTKYINASPINIINEKYFISTQGPKKETIEDFWTMVIEHNSNVIVMLCNEKEGGREKCAPYWKSGKLKNGYEINTKEIFKTQQYLIREIEIKINNLLTSKKVYQIHFIGWPDHGVPETQDGKIFDVFNEMIKKTDQYKLDGPIVVHCSAGVGRTGTFISIYYLQKEIQKQIDDKVQVIRFSIFNLVRKLKEMRLYLVQTDSQYYFIYEYVNDYLKKHNI